MDGSAPQIEPNLKHFSLLFEMLRSFSALAATLNLSQAVRELGSTRQTVRRHISQLEDLKGGALFDVSERQYELTALGLTVLPEAQDLLARSEGWIKGTTQLINGLQYLCQASDSAWNFYQQQQPISAVFESSSDLIRNVMRAWVDSGGYLEHPAMRPVRQDLMVYRRSGEKWLCVELGEKSSYVSWFGWADARSSIGRPLGKMPGGEGFARLVGQAHIEVETNQGVRLDHTFTQIPRIPDGDPVPICYERLLLAGKFPDDSFALLSTVRRTYDVEILGVSDEMLRQMPEDLLM
ncbi:MAG: LysR family transcriptional regulator [Paracoccaceae bacterium]